jgi:cell division transport system ATP-binding protein
MLLGEHPWAPGVAPAVVSDGAAEAEPHATDAPQLDKPGIFKCAPTPTRHGEYMSNDRKSPDALVRFEKVTHTYPGSDRPVLSGINLTIMPGEFVFLIGASGAGKSTLLRMLLAELRPTVGTAVVAGHALRKLRSGRLTEHRRQIGAVFQDFRLLEDRTVAQNVAFALHVIGARRSEIRHRVPEVLDHVGLAHLAARRPAELSGGEQQRVAVARAIVNRPRLLVADEPTGNLDPETTADIVNLLAQLNAEGLTVVMATHNVTVVDAEDRRVVELVDGRIVRDVARGRYNAATTPVE